MVQVNQEHKIICDKVKSYPCKAVEAHRDVRGQGSHVS
jgi:hypothetical protein